MTLYGWDASDFDHDRGMRAAHIQRAASEGIRFFTHKITEGTRVIHVYAGEKLTAAVSAGIPFVGAYVVPRTPGNNGHGSIAAQADYAIAQLGRQWPGWKSFAGFFWQIDTEKWGYDNVSPVYGEQLAVELERKTGKKAVHYAPKWAYGNTIPNPARPLWSSNYGPNSAKNFKTLYVERGGDSGAGWEAYSGRVPKIWQYGSKAIIGGQSTCDANAFRGTITDFAKMIGAPVTVPTTPTKLARWSDVKTNALGERMIAFIERYYPQAAAARMYVTTSLRIGDNGSHHGGTLTYDGSSTMAVDIGAYGDPAPDSVDQADMGLLADWLFKYFWDLTVELIHTQPHNDHETYVKNQVRVGPYVTADHVNHVHWATSSALMTLLEQRAQALWPTAPTAPIPQPPKPKDTEMYYAKVEGNAKTWKTDGKVHWEGGLTASALSKGRAAGIPLVEYDTYEELISGCGKLVADPTAAPPQTVEVSVGDVVAALVASPELRAVVKAAVQEAIPPIDLAP